MVSDDVHCWGHAVAEVGNAPTEIIADASDLQAVLTHVRNSVAVIDAYDINRDGKVDSNDGQVVQAVIDASPGPLLQLDLRGGSTLLGDVNRDGNVNGLDVMPFVEQILNSGYLAAADMNQDSLVNGLDVEPFVRAVVGESAASVAENIGVAPVEWRVPRHATRADGTDRRSLHASHRAAFSHSARLGSASCCRASVRRTLATR